MIDEKEFENFLNCLHIPPNLKLFKGPVWKLLVLYLLDFIQNNFCPIILLTQMDKEYFYYFHYF
jgi:hypothetical protein